MENFVTDTQGIEHSIGELLCLIGEDPCREGLSQTPKRIARMCREIFRGYDVEQKPHVMVFPNGSDGVCYHEMVVDTGDFHSLCEHHMLPFFGKYVFGYIPSEGGNLIGLSKIGRMVDWCAARLQVQERLCKDVVEELWEALSQGCEPPIGMALVMRGTHLCKTMRGARKSGTMECLYTKGEFSEDNKRALVDKLWLGVRC